MPVLRRGARRHLALARAVLTLGPDLLAPVSAAAYDAATRALSSSVGGSDEADARRVVNAAAPWVQRDLIGHIVARR